MPAGTSDDRALRTSWGAFGTTVVLGVTHPDALESARESARCELEAIDLACSRFRADSELSRVNRAAGRPVAVGELLMEALEVALMAAEVTDGDVDPTLGRALELAGYDRDWALLAPAVEGREDGTLREPIRVTARSRTGWRTVALDRAGATVTLARGLALDLGATAKAWAADRAARAAHHASGCGALVSIGGDIATSGRAPRLGWKVHVTDDHRSSPSAPGQRIAIDSGGLATSGTAVRRWSHDGRDMHHIIDPRTGQPAGGEWRTVSVAAATCTEANIASTAAIVRGAEAPAWLGELGLPARLVAHDGRARRVGEWPSDGELS